MSYATTPVYNFPLQQVSGATRICTWACTDSLATVLSAGYINPILALGHTVYANDVFVVTYSSATGPVTGMFIPVIAATGIVTLQPFEQGNVLRFNTAVGQAAVASAGHVQVFPVAAGMKFQCIDIKLSKGTNFSGNSGDRNLQLTDGTTAFTIVPAATLQTLTNSVWGSIAVPAPTGDFITATAAGVAPYIAYQGGTLDYSAGACTVSTAWLRVA